VPKASLYGICGSASGGLALGRFRHLPLPPGGSSIRDPIFWLQVFGIWLLGLSLIIAEAMGWIGPFP
jgi:hypothetical protein